MSSAISVVTDTYEYDAFGNKINSTGTTPNNYLYRGEQYDSDLGMYYLRARYYNPLTGRFASVDSQAGQGQRRYEYAGANPVDELDPSGNEAIIEWALLQFYPKRLPFLFPGFPKWCGFAMGGYLPGCGGGSGGAGGTGAGSGAPGGPPQPPPRCTGTNCKKYWITFAYYPQATHGFGHDGVAVGEGSPNDDDDGWATEDATSFWKLARGASVPGLLRDDHGVYGPTDGRRSRMGGRQVLHFPTDQAGAEAAEALILQRKGGNDIWNSWQDYPVPHTPPYDSSVGIYNLYIRNCAQFAEDVLHAGKVAGVPGHEVIEPAALWGILAYEQSWSDQ